MPAIKSRRSDLHCQGGKFCQYFDESLLEGYSRYEGNKEDMQGIFKLEMEANELEARSADAVTVR